MAGSRREGTHIELQQFLDSYYPVYWHHCEPVVAPLMPRCGKFENSPASPLLLTIPYLTSLTSIRSRATYKNVRGVSLQNSHHLAPIRSAFIVTVWSGAMACGMEGFYPI